jgi:UDP-GlcNAc:undecaprenyl-phosphate GlcNAc-1-phosphate transferase
MFNLLNFIQDHITFTVSVITLNIFSLLIISKAKHFNESFLKELLYIPARKSKSNAVVLGGLSLSLSALVTVYFFYSNSLMNTQEKLTSLGFFLATFLVTIHGYLDDKFEISAKIKLLSQLFAVFTFSIFIGLTLPLNSILYFIPIAIFWGFGTLNGSNLLDGLDTMTVKVSSVIFINFFIISLIFNVEILALLTFFFFIGIVCFYFFNKEPAKIHLGEIGANLLGLSYIFLSSIIYLNTRESLGNIDAVFLSLIPLSIPMIELAVSFIRRLYFKKSPFRSDRLHLHHILTRDRNLSASNASSATAFMFLIPTAISLIFLKENIVLTYFVHGFSTMGLYALTCYKYWVKDHKLESQKSVDVGRNLKSKNIKLVSSSIVEDFDIVIDDDTN